MKPFKLQSVLDYRILLKDLAQQELYRSREAEAALAAELARASTELAALHRELEARQREGISVQELAIYETHSEHRQQEIVRLEQELARLREQIARQMQALTEANRNKKLLEKLKEKALAQQELELRRKEAVAADETAGQKHAREKG